MPLRFPKLSWRTIIYGVVAVVIILVSLPFVYVGNEYRLKAKYQRALNRLQVGDTEETVVKLMGQPDERNWCYPLPTDHDTAEDKQFHQRCVETYMYVTFMENYGVSLDKDGRVSGKFHQVSP
jgi:hypothetical protein